MIQAIQETRPLLPCPHCGRQSHELATDRAGVTRCVSVPAKGHEVPGYQRRRTVHGQTLLVRLVSSGHELLPDFWRTPSGRVVEGAELIR